MVREGGRTVIVHALLATGVNGEGYREVLGVQFAGEDGADWLAFLRDLTARGLTGVKLVTGDAPAVGRSPQCIASGPLKQGIVDALAATPHASTTSSHSRPSRRSLHPRPRDPRMGRSPPARSRP